MVVAGADAAAVARRAAERLDGVVVLHERFGTATVRWAGGAFDVAAARRETYARPGALPDVAFVDDLTVDLGRRDFTVNAIGLELSRGSVLAHPLAREDVAEGVLRVLHDASFADDPTRLIRLARYSGRLGFGVEARTAELAGAAVAGGAPASVSGERLGAELRLLAHEPQPAAFVALERFGLGTALLGRFALDPGLTTGALASAPAEARSDLVALGSALGEDDDLASRLDRLAFPAQDRRVLLACARRPAVVAALERQPAPSAVNAVLRREPLELAVLAAAAGAEPARRWLTEWRFKRLSIDGHDLLAAGMRGPAVGAGLEAALAALLDGHAPDRDAQLAAAVAGEPT